MTSWSLLLAAAWPDALASERIVLEADPSGGVLGARFDLGVDPGVVSLIAAMRRTADRVVALEEHARRVSERVWVVPGPEVGEQARPVWKDTAADMAQALAVDDRVWLIDAGRLDDESVVLPFAVRSRCTLLVSGSRREDLVQLPARVESLARHGVSSAVLLIGDPHYNEVELKQFIGVSQVWSVRANPDLAVLAGEVLRPGRARRSWLWRSAVQIAAEFAQLVTVPTAAPARSNRHDSLAAAAGRLG